MRQLILILILLITSMLYVKCQSQIIDTDNQNITTDSYGGFLSIKGTPEAYFTIQKLNGRYCFVTPEGNGFLSIAITHLGVMDNNLFETKYNSSWDIYSNETELNLRNWGFNTVGYHSNSEMQKRMPYFLECYPMLSSGWRPGNLFSYEDVFDPVYQANVKSTIDDMVIKAGEDKNVIGYYWNDIPMWALDRTNNKRGKDWLTFYRGLPAFATGKSIYVNYLKERYNNNLHDLKSVYNIDATTWEDVKANSFSSTDRTNANVKFDDEGFLRLIAREHYRVLGTSTREKDPHRLILGERFLIGDLPDLVLEEQNKWVDAIAIQPVGVFNAAKFEQIHTLTKKPIMICDHQESFYTEEFPKTMWTQLPSEDAAARAYQDYLNQALSKPYILGYSRCQYLSKETGNVLKQGILDINGEPYEKLVESVAETNEIILKRFAEGSLTED